MRPAQEPASKQHCSATQRGTETIVEESQRRTPPQIKSEEEDRVD